jgi:hypothetical protein
VKTGFITLLLDPDHDILLTSCAVGENRTIDPGLGENRASNPAQYILLVTPAPNVKVFEKQVNFERAFLYDCESLKFCTARVSLILFCTLLRSDSLQFDSI